jgi:hypothetical protein
MNKKPPIPSTPKAVQDCRDLLLWMIPHLDKLPKNRRYTLGEKLENRVLTVLESLVSAANTAAAKNKAFKLKYLNMIHALARSAREKVWVVV